MARKLDPKRVRPKRLRVILKWTGIGLLLALFIAIAWVSVWIDGIASATYDRDILTLVPDDMAVTIAVRGLGDKTNGLTQLAQLEEVLSALIDDPAYDAAMRSDLAGRLFGVDAFGDPKRPERQFDTVNQQLDDLNERMERSAGWLHSLIGPLSLEKDVLLGELVVALRPTPGQSYQLIDIDPDATDSTVTRRLTRVYPKKQVLVLVRVSGKLKLALSQLPRFAQYAGNALKVFVDDGAVTVAMTRGATTTTFSYALIGDVLAASTSLDLVQNVALLDGAPNAAGSLFGDPAYRRVVSLARDAGDPLDAPIQMFLNADRVRWMFNWDTLLDIPNDLKRARDQVSQSAFMLLEDSIKAMLDMRHVQAGLVMGRLDSGVAMPAVASFETYVALHAAKLPAHMRDTYTQGASDLGITRFATRETFAVLGMRKDATAMEAHLAALAEERGGDDIMLEFFEELLPNLSGAMGIVLAPQDLSRPREPGAPPIKPLPLFCMLFALNDRGVEQGEALAEQPFRALFGISNDPGASSRSRFTRDDSGVHPITRFSRLDEDGNLDQSLVQSVFGPEADPAAAVYDRWLLVSTSAAYLQRVLAAAKSDRSPFGPKARGAAGELEDAFERKANAEGRFDVARFVTAFLSDETIRLMAAQNYPGLGFDGEPANSSIALSTAVQMQFRNAARFVYPNDPAGEEREYERLVAEEMDRLRNEREWFLTRRTAFRNFAGVVRVGGFELRSLGKPDAYAVHFSIGLGGGGSGRD